MSWFLLFKQAIALINRKEHLTEDGFRKIIGIKAAINWGLSEKLKIAFPNKYIYIYLYVFIIIYVYILIKTNVTPANRPLVEDQKIKDPNWLAGFTDGEGYFLVDIFKSSSVKSGFQVKLKFSLAQHTRDEKLLKSLVEYLGCGYYYERPNKFAGDFIVTKLADLNSKIIPFFNNYPSPLIFPPS